MSRCRDCGATWTGAKACHCTACHETFSSETTFAMHQGATEGCTPPAELKTLEGAARLVRNARGLWGKPGPGNDLWPGPIPSAETRTRDRITPRSGPEGQKRKTRPVTTQTERGV